MASSFAFWVEEVDSEDRLQQKKSNSNPEDSSVGSPQCLPKKEDQLTNNTQEQMTAELHFNYWLLERDNIEYLDIGIRIKGYQPFKSFNFYFPFEVEEADYYSELGAIICKDSEILSTVFNSSVEGIAPSEKSGWYDIKLADGADKSDLRFFTYLPLAPTYDGVRISNVKHVPGSEIIFPSRLFEMTCQKESYFRFRLKLKESSRGVISKTTKASDSWFTNHFERSELVDFRLNEARLLPTAIRQKVASRPLITKIHFFLIRDANAEYKASHSEYKRCRLLEEELWSKYLGDVKINEESNMLIYQWSAKAQITQEDVEPEYLHKFSAFARFIQRKVRAKDILIALIVVLLVGVFSGLAANAVWNYVPKCVQYVLDKLDSGDSESFFDTRSIELRGSSLEALLLKNPEIGSHSAEGELYEN